MSGSLIIILSLLSSTIQNSSFYIIQSILSSSEDFIKIVYLMDVTDSYNIADSDAEQAGAPFPPERDQVDAEAVQENLTVITQYFASTFVSTLKKSKNPAVEREFKRCFKRSLYY